MIEAIQYLSWPIVVVVLALIFRPSIRATLLQLKRLKWKDIELSFESLAAQPQLPPPAFAFDFAFRRAAVWHDCGKNRDDFQQALRRA
jgi:hypothetical protein